MFVKIYGKQVEVGVSDGGTFFDAETKTISAKSLKGLEKKLRTAHTPHPGVPVENATTRKQGMVTGRTGRKWNSTYTVRWEDGVISQENAWRLRRPTTEAQRAEMARLEAIQTATSQANNKAANDLHKYVQQFDAATEISTAFPHV